MEKWKRGAHGNTFGGNPLCCAAALATLDLVEHEYAANAATVGEYFLARLRELQERFACIGDVRGKGLMIGMELVDGPRDACPARALCEARADARIPQWPAAAVLWRQYRAFHSAAHDQPRARR